MSRIVVLGAGAWGTAIALSLCRRGGHEVSLWAHSSAESSAIDAARENTLFLPGFPLPSELAVTADLAPIAEAQIIVSVIPSEFLRSTLQRVKGQIHNGQFIVSATKGVEKGTHSRMTQVISNVLEPAGTLVSIGALSGPSFALEVAQGFRPVVLVMPPTELARPVSSPQQILHSRILWCKRTSSRRVSAQNSHRHSALRSRAQVPRRPHLPATLRTRSSP